MIVSSSKDLVISEEGIHIQPEITVEDFNKDDYYALVLTGISDLRPVLDDNIILNFLRSLKDETEFIIGAIGSSPLLLSLTGILDNKKFTNSLWKEMNEEFKCIDINNFVYAPLIVDGNIITANGYATRLFALEVGKQAGLTYYPDGLKETTFENYDEERFKQSLSEEQLKDVRKVYSDLIDE